MQHTYYIVSQVVNVLCSSEPTICNFFYKCYGTCRGRNSCNFIVWSARIDVMDSDNLNRVNCGNLSITVHGWITISTHAFVAITSDSISMARCHGHYLLSCSFGYYIWTASTRYSTLVLLFFLASFFCKDKQKQSSYFNQSFSCPYFKHAKITCTCNNTHPHVS